MTDRQTNHLRRYPPPFEIVLPTVDNVSYHLDTRNNLSTAWTSLQAHFGGTPPDGQQPRNLPQSEQERGTSLSHGRRGPPHTVLAAFAVPRALRVQEPRPRTPHSVADRTHPGASPISHPVVVLYHTEPPRARRKSRGTASIGATTAVFRTSGAPEPTATTCERGPFLQERTPWNRSPVLQPPKPRLIRATDTGL